LLKSIERVAQWTFLLILLGKIRKNACKCRDAVCVGDKLFQSAGRGSCGREPKKKRKIPVATSRNRTQAETRASNSWTELIHIRKDILIGALVLSQTCPSQTAFVYNDSKVFTFFIDFYSGDP